MSTIDRASKRTLLPAGTLRRELETMSAAELLQRCDRAAGLELCGESYRDARAEVAAQILADGLARTAGTLPRRDDPQHSLTAYCGRARTLRRSIDRERERERKVAQERADAEAVSVHALTDPEELTLERESRDLNRDTPQEAMSAAVQACARVGCGTDIAVWTLMYRHAREAEGLKGAAIVRELASLAPDDAPPTVKALDTRCARARARIAGAYSDAAADFLRRLTGSASPLLSFGPDWSRAAVGHGETPSGREMRQRAADWREGTDAGRKPYRPETAAAAREVCKLRRTRTRTPKLDARNGADLTAARSSLLDAQRIARSPVKPRPRHGVKAGTKR